MIMSNSKELDYGVVKVFHSLKGFGFIQRPKGKDVFFFFQDIKGDDGNLNEGDTVRFTLQQESKGPRAYDIEKTG